MNEKIHGMRRKLTDYGDAEFSLYLRKAFIKAMGLSDDALSLRDPVEKPRGSSTSTGEAHRQPGTALLRKDRIDKFSK